MHLELMCHSKSDSTMKKLQLLSLLIVLQLFGCSDFLDVNPQSELTQESFPTTAADALLATNAAYSTLRNWSYHSGGFPILDIMSDDTQKGSNPDDGINTIGPFDNFTLLANQDGLDRWWATLYQGVRYANVVIEFVPEIAMPESIKNRYLGEALFLRGLYYFDLVRAWGDVPLVTSATAPLSLARTDVATIYAQIEDDLTRASSLLPKKDAYEANDLGRATQGAAKSLLAKVYLFQNDFAKAEPLLLEVINSGNYDLEPNFEDANGRDGEHGVESILEVGAVEVQSSIGNQYANTQGVRGTPNRGWGFNRPTINLREAFENGDPRKDASIIELGDVLDGITILGDGVTPDETKDEQGRVIEIESYNQKIWIPGLATDTQFGHNRRILRFADVLLMAAEALNENGKSAQALPHLNRVRERARAGNMAILPAITEQNQSMLRALILQERRVELAMEGHRFWDLVRTGNAAEVLGPLGFQSAKHELLPIPQNEIDISLGVLTQNPNWN